MRSGATLESAPDAIGYRGPPDVMLNVLPTYMTIPRNLTGKILKRLLRGRNYAARQLTARMLAIL